VLGVHKNTYMGDYGGVVVSILYSQYVHVIASVALPMALYKYVL